MAVSPGKYNPLKPDIELFDYASKKRFGLKLDGPGALQIGTISQDDTVHIRTQGKRVGDFDEQRSWKGGRGIDKLSDNPSGYWDSYNAWTLSDGHLHQTLLWEFARGLRSSDVLMPSRDRSMHWRSLLSSQRYISISFVASATYSADYARIWIKKIGVPGTLTVELCADNSGDPGTVLKTATISTISGLVSKLEKFDWDTTQSLTAGTTYHVKVYGASTDNKNNHWQVGGNEDGTTGKLSSDNSVWSSASFDLYHFVADADVRRTFFSFVLDEAFYLVDKKDAGGNSQVYINGDRGKASGSGSTSLTDSSKSWVTNRWAGAVLNVVRGTGAGSISVIASNTSTVLTLQASISTDSTSEYVITKTPWFTEISTGITFNQCYSQPIVVNQIVYFPVGGAIRRMIWTGSAHAFGTSGSSQAHFMIAVPSSGGTRVYRLVNGQASGAAKTISFATAQNWANPPTDLAFGSLFEVGDATYPFNGISEKDGVITVFKANGNYSVVEKGTSLTIVNIKNGIDKTPSKYNGAANIVHQQFIYYSWLHSAIRVYGSSHDDIGQDWSGYGLPDNREGVFSSFDTYTSLLIAAMNASDRGIGGTSSVLGWDGLGWHEILRAYDTNLPCRMVKVQVVPSSRNRMWADFGGDLVFQEMPFQKGSPRLDSGVRYYHEAVVESSAIDMGTASGLAKFIKELSVYCENLGENNEIYVDYQVDDNVHTDNWTHATVLYESPESVAFLGLENIRKFAYRLRILSSDNTTPVDIQGVVPNGYARVPYKMVWTMRCRADNISSRGRLVKPPELMRWLLDNARYPGRVEMRSQYELAHKFYVIIHPPRMFPYKPAQAGQPEESIFTLVLEEV